jgi:phosphoserine aminotransferase
MNWIKKTLGVSELIKEQKQTNELLKEVIHWQKHNINNDCEPHSRKRSAFYNYK